MFLSYLGSRLLCHPVIIINAHRVELEKQSHLVGLDVSLAKVLSRVVSLTELLEDGKVLTKHLSDLVAHISELVDVMERRGALWLVTRSLLLLDLLNPVFTTLLDLRDRPAELVIAKTDTRITVGLITALLEDNLAVVGLGLAVAKVGHLVAEELELDDICLLLTQIRQLLHHSLTTRCDVLHDLIGKTLLVLVEVLGRLSVIVLRLAHLPLL